MTSMKAALGCSPASMKFQATKADKTKFKELQKWDRACDKVGSAFFNVTAKEDILTYAQLQKSVALYFGWFAWIFIKWAAPKILAFLWERTHDKRPF